jgi:predicted permease
MRHAFRRAARNPGFACAAVTTLALGIGASTVMFSVVHSVLLRPLPYAEPDQLVRVYLASPERGVQRGALSLPDLRDWQEQNSVFSSLAGYFSFTRNLTGSGDPASLRTTYVSEGFFETMETGAILGRVLSREELTAAVPAVVLSHAAWTQHFGRDPSVIGTSLNLDDVPHAVVGVMPPEFRFPDAETGIWLPLPLLVAADLVPVNRSARWLATIGRLSPGRTAEQAELEMTQITGRLAEEYLATNEGWTHATVRELRHTIVGDVGLSLLVALAAVLFVLLMVCSNLAGLLLARATASRREMAVRAALGAGRARLARELFAESLMVAILGGTAGVLLAAWGMDAIRQVILPILPRVADARLDSPVLAFASLTTLFSSVLCGMTPALRATGSDLQEALKDGGRSGSGSRTTRLRSGLVVGQVALAVVLTISAGLMLKSFQQLRSIDPGFNPDGVLAASMQIPIPPDRSELRARIIERTDRIVERLRAIPGVMAVGSVNVLPLRGDGGLLALTPGSGQTAGAAQFMARPRTVSGHYFRVMQIPLLAGALFPESMAAGAPTSAVVSYTTARRLWPGQNPVGREFWMGVPYRVVGVVGDVSDAGLTEEPPLTVYRHHSQQPLADVTLVIRAHSDPLLLAGAVREAIRSVDGSQSVRSLGTLAGVVSESVAQERFFTILLGGFGASAVLIATLGLYSTLAYVVGRQTREIGVRMALGARRSDVLRMVLGRGLLLAGIGIVIGMVAALGLTSLLAGMLHRVATVDPPTYVTVASLLLLTAVVAGYIPARRATRTDPLVALRAE